MADWDEPTVLTAFATVITDFKNRDTDLATMFDVGSPTNIPTNSVRLNKTNKRFELWSGSVWNAALADYAITVAGVVAGGITSGMFAAGAVDSTALGTNSVIAGKIAAGAVTQSKIGTGAVDSDQIAANAIIAAKIGTGAVDSDALATDSVIAAKIAAGAVTEAKIGAGAVTQAKIGTGAVGSTQIAAGAVDSSELATDAVTTAKIAAAQVTLAKMANDSVDTNQLVALAVSSAKIADNAVGLAKIAHVSSGSFGALLYWNDTGVPALLLPGAAGTVLTSNGANVSPSYQSPKAPALSAAAAVSLSGLSEKDWTNIPANARIIKIQLDQVTLSSGGEIEIVLGTASSYETAGYLSTAVDAGGNRSVTDAFTLTATSVATDVWSGVCEIVMQDSSSNRWNQFCIISNSNAGETANSAGGKALSGVVTRVKIQVTVGTFDGGTANVMWIEG
jgi:hypothetical protein